MKIVPGFLLEGNGFDKGPNYDAKGLSEQPKGVSQSAVDAIGRSMQSVAKIRDAEIRDKRATEASVADVLKGFGIDNVTPDGTEKGVQIGKFVGQDGVDMIRLSAGGKTQDFRADIFNDPKYRNILLSKFAANNGVKTEFATATTTLPSKATAQRVAPSHASSQVEARKPEPTLGEEIANLKSDIAKFDEYINSLQSKGNLTNIETQGLANGLKLRAATQSKLDPLLAQQKIIDTQARQAEARTAAQSREREQMRQAQEDYEKLSPAGKAVRDLDVALRELLKKEVMATGENRQAIRKEASAVLSKKLVAQQVVALEDQIAVLNKEQPSALRGSVGVKEWKINRDENVAKLQGQKDSLMPKLEGPEITRYAGRGLSQKTA